MKFNEYPDRDMLAVEVASEIAGNLEMHLLHHETASLAVAGGTTPAPIFDDLCAADIAWDRVHVMATDERWVPLESARIKRAYDPRETADGSGCCGALFALSRACA